MSEKDKILELLDNNVSDKILHKELEKATKKQIEIGLYSKNSYRIQKYLSKKYPGVIIPIDYKYYPYNYENVKVYKFFENFYREPYECDDCNIDVILKLINKQVKFVEKQHKPILKSLYNYTKDPYFNEKLIKYIKREESKDLDNILNLFLTIPSITSDIVVYSGRKHLVKSFYHKQIISTSMCYVMPLINFTDRNTKLGIGRCCLYEFHIKRGCKIIPIIFEWNTHELEIILCSSLCIFEHKGSYIKDVEFTYEKNHIISKVTVYIINCYPKF